MAKSERLLRPQQTEEDDASAASEGGLSLVEEAPVQSEEVPPTVEPVIGSLPQEPTPANVAVPPTISVDGSKVVPPELVKIFGNKVPPGALEVLNILKEDTKKRERYVAQLAAREEEKKRIGSKNPVKPIKKKRDKKTQGAAAESSEPAPEIPRATQKLEDKEQKAIDRRIKAAHAAEKLNRAEDKPLPAVFHSNRRPKKTVPSPESTKPEPDIESDIESDLTRPLEEIFDFYPPGEVPPGVWDEGDSSGVTSVAGAPLAAEGSLFKLSSEDIPTYIQVGNEDTRKGFQDRLRALIEGAKEKLGTGERVERTKSYLKERSKSLQEKAKEYGSDPEKLVRDLGKTYNKLSLKKKLAIGAGLGIGAAAFSGVSTLIAGVFITGLVVQRAAGMASKFLEMEKKLEDAANPEAQGFLAKIAERPKEQRKIAAAIMAVGYTAVVSSAIAGAVEIASEFSWDEAVHEWLGRMSAPEAPVSVREAVGKIGAPAAEVAQPAAAAAAGEVVASAPALEMPTVESSAGHGYEYMMKQLWGQLHEGGVSLPANADPNSDLYKLIHADEKSIDTVVHRIAADMDEGAVKHGFFNPDGTSVRISEGAHMTLDTEGNIRLDGVVHAPADAPVTPMPHVEAPTPAVEAPSMSIEEVAPQDVVPTVDLTPEQDIAAQRLAEAAPVQAAAEQAESIVNAFGLEVLTTEPHIYAAAGALQLFVYGGSPVERADAVRTYLAEHPDATIYGADGDGLRIPWNLVDGKVVPGARVQTQGLLGFFKSFMKAPSPEEFAKIIK